MFKMTLTSSPPKEVEKWIKKSEEMNEASIHNSIRNSITNYYISNYFIHWCITQFQQDFSHTIQSCALPPFKTWIFGDDCAKYSFSKFWHDTNPDDDISIERKFGHVKNTESLDIVKQPLRFKSNKDGPDMNKSVKEPSMDRSNDLSFFTYKRKFFNWLQKPSYSYEKGE